VVEGEVVVVEEVVEGEVLQQLFHYKGVPKPGQVPKPGHWGHCKKKNVVA
jgi:hypothetical protein